MSDPKLFSDTPLWPDPGQACIDQIDQDVLNERKGDLAKQLRRAQ